MYKRESMIKGFILPYLGQQDAALPICPPNLVRRAEVFGYPTNFAAMSKDDSRPDRAPWGATDSNFAGSLLP